MALQKFAVEAIGLKTNDILIFLPKIFSSPIEMFYNIADCFLSELVEENKLNILFIRTIFS